MILIEKSIETALRTAIRASLNTYGASTAELIDIPILGYWLGAEDGGAADDAEGVRVELTAHPSSSEGWIAGVGPEPQRAVMLDVRCITQPDSDPDRAVCCALYEAVRNVFETPGLFTLPPGLTFGGMQIKPGGAGAVEGEGWVVAWTVKMDVSL